MLYIDYTIQAPEDGVIVFDNELTGTKLNIKNGDVFVASVKDNDQITFTKTYTDEC